MEYYVKNSNLRYNKSCGECPFRLPCAIADNAGELGPQYVLDTLIELDSKLLTEEELAKITKAKNKIETGKNADPTNDICILLQKTSKVIKRLERERAKMEADCFE